MLTMGEVYYCEGKSWFFCKHKMSFSNGDYQLLRDHTCGENPRRKGKNNPSCVFATCTKNNLECRFKALRIYEYV